MSSLMFREFISWSKATYHLSVHYNSQESVTLLVYLGRLLYLTPLICLHYTEGLNTGKAVVN